MKLLLLLILTFPVISGFSQKETKNSVTAGCQIIEKPLVGKGEKDSEYKDLYLRCSIQDYYIKFCESKVSRKKLVKHIDKGIEVTYEIKDGDWDTCAGDPEMQSRVGTYVVILSFKKPVSKKRIKTKF